MGDLQIKPEITLVIQLHLKSAAVTLKILLAWCSLFLSISTPELIINIF
jgi:hypothetical protein